MKSRLSSIGSVIILCVVFLFTCVVSGCGATPPEPHIFTTYGTVRSVLLPETHGNPTRMVLMFEYDNHPKSLYRIEFQTVEPNIEQNMHVKLTYRQATLWEVGWVGRGEDPAYSQYDHRPIFKLLSVTQLE